MNNKKRKLRYIRDKNHINKGGLISFTVKISTETLENTTVVKEIINSQVLNLSKKFKTPLKINETRVGWIHDDYKKNRQTCRVTLIKK